MGWKNTRRDEHVRAQASDESAFRSRDERQF
jgi:hypothetical protein